MEAYHCDEAIGKKDTDLINDALVEFEREGLLKAQPTYVKEALSGVSLSEDFNCLICKHALFEPLECKNCGNHFCRLCLQE